MERKHDRLVHGEQAVEIPVGQPVRMLGGRLQPEQIDHINAHGTATPENDKMEYNTTAVVFGFAVIAGVFFWLLDLFLAWATRHLTGQGG